MAITSAKQLFAALSEGRFNEARQFVNAQLKKDPASPLYNGVKVYIAYLDKNRWEVEECSANALQHINKQTLRTFLIQPYLQYNLGKLLSDACERVNRQDPHDHEVTDTWIECAFELGDLEMAQKALMATLRHASASNQRRCTLHACLVMALNFLEQNNVKVPRISTAFPLEDSSSQVNTTTGSTAKTGSANTAASLFPKLAERMLEKHLPVQNAQECYVAALVYRMQSAAAANTFLASNMFFVQGSLDLEMLLLDTTEEVGDHDKAYEYGIAGLEHNDSLDLWKLLNRTAVASNHSISPVQALREAAVTVNQMIAEIDWAKRRNDTENLNLALVACWKKLKTKPGCFMLLKNYVTKDNVSLLNDDGLNDDGLLNNDHTTVPRLINLAKLRRSVNLPCFEESVAAKIMDSSNMKQKYLADTSSNLYVWLELYNQHIGESPVEKRDYFFNTDALLMATTELLRSASSEQIGEDDNYTRERAILILEYALKEDPFNFNVKLLLVQLYRSLGLHKHAQSLYKSLGTKNIQLEGMSHWIFTRIATLDPEHCTYIMSALDNLSDMSYGGYCVASLRHAAYTQFHSVFELGKIKKFSMCGAQFQLEKFRLNTFRSCNVQIEDIQAIEITKLYEDRDFKTGFDDGLGSISDSNVPSISIGPRPDLQYIETFKDRETLLAGRIHNNNSGPQPTEPKELPASLTDIEKWNIQVLSTALLRDHVKNSSKQLGVPEPPQGRHDWRFIHWCLTIVETLKALQSVSTNSGFDVPAIHSLLRSEIKKRKQKLLASNKNGLDEPHRKSLPGGLEDVVASVRKEYITCLETIEAINIQPERS